MLYNKKKKTICYGLKMGVLGRVKVVSEDEIRVNLKNGKLGS